MNELLEALAVLEKEKNINRDILLDAIENSLVMACKNQYGKADNVVVDMNRETGEFHVYMVKKVVKTVEDPALEISVEDAKKVSSKAKAGSEIKIEIQSKDFGRIVTQTAKNTILQKRRRTSCSV